MTDETIDVPAAAEAEEAPAPARIFFSPGTGGFFHSAFHETIPPDAVEIDHDRHQALLLGQGEGQAIVAGEDGAPVLANRASSAEERLAAVRRKRDRMLAASDFTQLPDVLAPEARGRWAAFRKALRDLVPAAEAAIAAGRDVAWPAPPG